MIALLVLASMSRCVSAGLCPTDEQLIAAIRARDEAFVQSASNQAAQDYPTSIVMIHSERIKRIADALCGGKLPSDLAGDPPVINCKFTVRYWSQDDYHIARMVLRSDGWEIADALVVTRERR